MEFGHKVFLAESAQGAQYRKIISVGKHTDDPFF